MRECHLWSGGCLLLVWLSVLHCGCAQRAPCPSVAFESHERQPLTVTESRGARVGDLGFDAFCFPDGDAWVLLLKVTNLGKEGVLVAREPDRLCGFYITDAPPKVRRGFLMGRIQLQDENEESQLDYDPVNFVYLKTGDCFTRRYRLEVADVNGIRDLVMTYYHRDGPNFRHKPFAGDVLLPEVPLLEQ